jgi:hypothetical protein
LLEALRAELAKLKAGDKGGDFTAIIIRIEIIEKTLKQLQGHISGLPHPHPVASNNVDHGLIDNLDGRVTQLEGQI